MKNGPPQKAVIIPIGISCGAIIMRAKASAQTKNIPPNKALTGITYL